MKAVAIIGGGPAGMSCALWCKLYGLEPVIIERTSELGGLQNLNCKTNAWVLGLLDHSGPEIAKLYQQHIEEKKIPIIYDAKLESIERQAEKFQIKLRGQEAQNFAAIVWATGTRIRGHESLSSIPGFEKIKELISFAPLDGVNPELYAGKTIAVLGGGDNAYQSACLIARAAKRVYLIHRSQARAQQQLINQAIELKNLTIYHHSEIRSLSTKPSDARLAHPEQPELTGASMRIARDEYNAADEALEADSVDLSQKLTLLILQDGQKIETEYIFARLGYLPNSEIITQFMPELELDSTNYVKVDPYTMQTSLAGVYAIGDLSDPINPCVPTAVASGTVAARDIEKLLSS
ncbi:MAG: NAD(P)/FAD-dependent oxidoreductase [Candidatus Melainabacteria bacterium]|nr:NAD(P)/FAD-dependent oxidoreductase [Candidatus Melainabacteria bacterium]